MNLIQLDHSIFAIAREPIKHPDEMRKGQFTISNEIKEQENEKNQKKEGHKQAVGKKNNIEEQIKQKKPHPFFPFIKT